MWYGFVTLKLNSFLFNIIVLQEGLRDNTIGLLRELEIFLGRRRIRSKVTNPVHLKL